jgi:hypothetical protein
VPAIGREGMERIKDTNDAREWQEAVKSILVDEIRGRASKSFDENIGSLQTLHSSIELFQKNSDLVPGTKQFDVDLANRFAKLVTPYELRVEGKLHGYTIPVQPIIEQLREQMKAERTAAAAQAPPPTPANPAPPARRADPPQAGIASKAGSSGTEAEDFSALFGTIGLPNLQI